ncbi:PEP/pyruvate-binding domain-containing protein [Rhodococcus cercidiphylli]|uniref:PEP/pyruvate-binding domain-containing protein n=1 Tax=Rhodococcus cercidiphylli TaxID=489916 RepID=A0ABU4AWK1_9NOCA|nr:PEP/pyruvate-binding domain-containing protein [Rhodococcus cercidiphylli]MDV6230600.1 PEP/pyruvate-binding domain-containing protein [Rhodococcus cercidiphylli]
MNVISPPADIATSVPPEAIYAFDHAHGLAHSELVQLLGGKGAGLAEMSTTLGMDVPPGFTISVPVCRSFLDAGWPNWLDGALEQFVLDLSERMGRSLGDPFDPLLVAVRSGAPVSMPGMLDTVLNLGLNDSTVDGLATMSGSADFAWDSYRRFLTMYAVTVMGVDNSALTTKTASTADGDLRGHVEAIKSAISDLAGRSVPTDPIVQLKEAIAAVFDSWNSPRAQTYRAKEGIDADLGTAVTVQAMVFGNRGSRSGTGVVFTRDPSTGAPGLYGDYLPRAQGEDVVSGTARTLPVADLESLDPQVYEQLTTALRDLEIHYRDMCDVEFTVEEGKLWLLQTRPGKRGASAAVRIAAALAQDTDIRLTPSEVLERVTVDIRERARKEALAHVADAASEHTVVTRGLGASPGRATGRVVLTSEDAADAEDDVILVRPETSPEDVAGMAASVGLLTTKGGLVSHAAVVARGWGIPAVVGAHDLRCQGEAFVTPGGQMIRAGDVLTIDGTTGCVWLGTPESQPDDTNTGLIERVLPELLVIDEWATNSEKTRKNSMKVVVDRTKCTALGNCEAIAPDFFEVDDDGDLTLLREDVTEAERTDVEAAIAACPTAALHLAHG